MSGGDMQTSNSRSSAWSALQPILALARPRAGVLLLGLVVSVAALLCGLALMGVAGATVSASAMGAGIAATMLLRLLGGGRVTLRYFERLATHAATFRVLADIRVWFFRRLANSSAGGLGFRQAGDVLARLVSDIEALDGLYLRVAVPLAGALVMVPVLAVVIGWQNAFLAVAVLGLFACAAFVLPFWALRTAQDAGQRAADASANLRVAVVDAISARSEIMAVGAEGRTIATVQAREAVLLAVQRDLARRGAVWNALAFLCGQGVLLLILLVAGVSATGAVVAAFLSVAAFEAVGGLPRAGMLAGQAAAAARRVVAAAGTEPAVPDPPVAQAPSDEASLRFEGIGFRWADDRQPVFSGLSLNVAVGSRVALLGPSGAGKSTLAALTLKLAVPQQGRILLGGIDIAQLRAADVRNRVAWLSQATHLFDDTVRANLLLARPDADDAALWQALEAAQIADVVRGMPDGLDSWVGESGAHLSGGQGRRLALARALLSPARIWILDEPCAGLDLETEKEFYAALDHAAQGRTILLIAHRLTGAENLDRVWRLSQGAAIPAMG